MQTITLRERIGDDGILRLQMPVEPRGAEVEIVVVIQPSIEANSNGHAAKRTSFADFAGALQDETFEIPEELPWETNRLPIE